MRSRSRIKYSDSFRKPPTQTDSDSATLVSDYNSVNSAVDDEEDQPFSFTSQTRDNSFFPRKNGSVWSADCPVLSRIQACNIKQKDEG